MTEPSRAPGDRTPSAGATAYRGRPPFEGRRT
jgi:hypothetical protein